MAWKIPLKGIFSSGGAPTGVGELQSSETVHPDNLGLGARTGLKYLRDDGTWVDPPAPPALKASSIIHGYFLGLCANVTGTIRRYVPAPMTIIALKLRVPLPAPTPSTVTLRKNGLVVASAVLSANTVKYDSGVLAIQVDSDDYLTLDLACAGISDLSVQVIYQ